jgi:hypothetical protein
VTDSGRSRQDGRRRRINPVSHDEVLVDSRLVPVVIMTDPGNMYDPDEYGRLHGFNLVRERYCGLESWRQGPQSFGLTVEEWRTLTIIVPKPLLMPEEDGYWQAFVAQLKQLTGREPESSLGDLIFR